MSIRYIFYLKLAFHIRAPAHTAFRLLDGWIALLGVKSSFDGDSEPFNRRSRIAKRSLESLLVLVPFLAYAVNGRRYFLCYCTRATSSVDQQVTRTLLKPLMSRGTTFTFIQFKGALYDASPAANICVGAIIAKKSWLLGYSGIGSPQMIFPKQELE